MYEYKLQMMCIKCGGIDVNIWGENPGYGKEIEMYCHSCKEATKHELTDVLDEGEDLYLEDEDF